MKVNNKKIASDLSAPYYGIGLALFFCLLSLDSQAWQLSLSIKGKITNAESMGMPGVLVEVKETGARTVSGEDGTFTLPVARQGIYTVTAFFMGFKTLERKVEVTAGDSHITLEMEEEALALGETVVYRKSESTEIKEQAIKTTVIDMEEWYSQPSNLTDLLNRSAGIRIRQAGGLGATTEISFNGFQGKSIRYFRDGVPMEYLGEGFSIASLPVNMLDRVEVYKGVLPISLGSDALGGAVNLISRKPKGNVADVSYEIASFNTHRANLNTYFTKPGQRWFAGVNGFYNRSDNDYFANVRVTDPETRNQFNARLPLFHNGFTGFFVQGFAGVRDLPWADELRLEFSAFETNREQQHPALMTDPYGAITSRQRSSVPAIHYTKTWKRLSVKQFLAYNNLIINRTDTLRGQYDWYGHLTVRPDRLGESRQASLSNINNYYLTSNTNLTYALGEFHSLEFNNVFTRATRNGTDPYGPRFTDTDIDVASLTSTYNKLVSSLGWEAFLKDRRWSNLLMGKYFNFSSEGVETWQARPIFTDEVSTVSGNNWGVGNAIKFEPRNNLLFRFSAEYANRLPDHMELFGNGVWVVQNFGLRPERSLNLTLGTRVSVPEKYTIEANTFFRRTKDLILLIPIQAPYARYENQENVRGFGVELDGNVKLTARWQVTANATWQELRLFGIENPTDSWKNDARLRNTPYMFANLGINYASRPILGDRAFLKLYGLYSYLREFYLETIPKRLEGKGAFGTANVNTELVIPSQHLLSAGFHLAFSQERFALGAEIKNLLNSDLYDNYRVQLAGRSLHLKLNYSIY